MEAEAIGKTAASASMVA